MWGNDESDTRGKFVRVHVPGNVLIIDDIATNRIVMKVRLAAASYRVIQATGGAEGLAAARRHAPDLILCSAQIADLAPAAFARALRSDPATRSIPLVFEALRRDAAAHYALLEAGADDILLKPHDEQLLLARLRSLLRMKETAEELTLREGASRNSKQVANIVTATLDGMVLDIPVEEGSSVIERNNFNEGTSIAIVANMNNLIFEGKVDEADVGKLKEGMPMELTVGAIESDRFDATLEFISPKGEDEEGTVKFEVRAAVKPTEETFLRAGYSANADIILDRRRQVVAIKERDVLFEEDTTYVEIRNGNQEFEKRPVKLGLSDGILVEVLEGVDTTSQVKVQLAKS